MAKTTTTAGGGTRTVGPSKKQTGQRNTVGDSAEMRAKTSTTRGGAAGAGRRGGAKKR